MSDITTSASAIGLPDRRLFLATTGAAAMAASALKSPARAAEASQLADLIERHKAARKAFCDAVDAQEEAERTGEGVEEAEALWQETDAAERASAVAMLAYPCRTIEEARAKGSYILTSPLHAEIHDHDLLAAFLRSFVDAPAQA
jgi:hypothetical protein